MTTALDTCVACGLPVPHACPLLLPEADVPLRDAFAVVLAALDAYQQLRDDGDPARAALHMEDMECLAERYASLPLVEVTGGEWHSYTPRQAAQRALARSDAPSPPPEASPLRLAYHAEVGYAVPGWWSDGPDAGELTWFLSTPEGSPWTVAVYSTGHGRWTWDLDWCPMQSHHGAARGLPSGETGTAWEAMQAARAAYEARPRGKGADQECPECYGWGCWCDHGGGPPHACEPCEHPRECGACKGGTTPPKEAT